MSELLEAHFKIDFQAWVVVAQGFISASLFTFWLASRANTLTERIASSKGEGLWFVSALLFGICIGVFIGIEANPEFAFAGLFLGLSLGLALFDAAVALAFFSQLLFLRPWELTQAGDLLLSLPQIGFLVCVGHMILRLAEQRTFFGFWNRSSVILVLYGVWCYATTFTAWNSVESKLVFSTTLIKAIFLYFMMLNTLRTPKEVQLILGSFTLIFLGVGLIAIAQTVGLMFARGELVRLEGIGAFSNSNDAAALMVLATPVALIGGLRSEVGKLWRVACLVSVLVFAFAIVLSQSRGAMLALAIGMSLFGVLRLRNPKRALIFLGVLSTLALGGLSLVSRDAGDLEESSASRRTFVEAGIRMGLANPIVGVGVGGFEENFTRYARGMVYEWGNRTAHNSWVLAFSETGLIGFLLFSFLLFSGLTASYRIFAHFPEFLPSYSAYCISIFFLSHTYWLYPYFLLALIGVAERSEEGLGRSRAPR